MLRWQQTELIQVGHSYARNDVNHQVLDLELGHEKASFLLLSAHNTAWPQAPTLIVIEILELSRIINDVSISRSCAISSFS